MEAERAKAKARTEGSKDMVRDPVSKKRLISAGDTLRKRDPL